MVIKCSALGGLGETYFIPEVLTEHISCLECATIFYNVYEACMGEMNR